MKTFGKVILIIIALFVFAVIATVINNSTKTKADWQTKLDSHRTEYAHECQHTIDEKARGGPFKDIIVPWNCPTKKYVIEQLEQVILTY